MSTTVELNKENLALTATLLSVLQQSWKVYELLTNVVGTTFVISGCVDTGMSVTAGYVSVNNEIMPFMGGSKDSDLVRVVEEEITVTAQDGSYKRINKKLVFGGGSGQFPYSELHRPDNLIGISSQLDNKASTDALNNLSTTVNNKVDKVAGKQLTTNDFTTALLNKLNDIAFNANNYTHPGSHPISMISGLQDSLSAKVELLAKGTSGPHDFKDGGIEADSVTISLGKTLPTSNYIVLGVLRLADTTTAGNNDSYSHVVHSLTTTSFKIYVWSNVEETNNIYFDYLLIAL